MVKHAGGRPLKYKTPEEIQAAIDVFFSECDTQEKPYTITGLALALGFTSRQALLNYEDRPEFFDSIKSAKLRVEMFAEQRLFGPNAAGAIFALKNYDWRDTQDVRSTGTVKHVVSHEPLSEEAWEKKHTQDVVSSYSEKIVN